MAQNFNPREQRSAREVYGDIIDLPRWEPNANHPRMSPEARAAQFAPYAALSGYHEMVDEEARVTDREIVLTDSQKEEIKQKLDMICDAAAAGDLPEVTVTYFVPDLFKDGGSYASATVRVRRVDSAAGKILLVPDGQPDGPGEILLERIVSIEGGIVSCLDE